LTGIACNLGRYEASAIATESLASVLLLTTSDFSHLGGCWYQNVAYRGSSFNANPSS